MDLYGKLVPAWIKLVLFTHQYKYLYLDAGTITFSACGIQRGKPGSAI